MLVFGVDSFVAVEIRSGLRKHLHADVSIFEISRNVVLAELGRKLAFRVGFLTV